MAVEFSLTEFFPIGPYAETHQILHGESTEESGETLGKQEGVYTDAIGRLLSSARASRALTRCLALFPPLRANKRNLALSLQDNGLHSTATVHLSLFSIVQIFLV